MDKKFLSKVDNDENLILDNNEKISARKVYAQDLLADEAEDCTGAVTIHGNTLILSGDWIDRTGLAARTHENDTSEPGLILKLS